MAIIMSRKTYEAPESEAITFALESVCVNPSDVTQNSITNMEEPEDL